jgi:hypothetical protein
VSDYVDNYKDIYDGVHDVLVLNEDADSSDEEEEADGMSFFFCGMSCRVFNCFCFLDGQLRNLIMENLSLMWVSMYPVVLREIAVEETALVNEMMEIMSLERAARERVVFAYNEFGLDYDASLLDAEIEGYGRLLGDCGRRRSELSALGQVVQELHDLEGDVTFYDDYTLEELRNVLEEVTVASKNVSADWVGGVHVD